MSTVGNISAAVKRTGRRSRDLKSVLELFELVDIVTPCAIRVAADLGIADQLIDGPKSVEELAAATQTHPPTLYRLLRALACRQIFVEVATGCFDLTPKAALLTSDHPLSLRSALAVLPSEIRTLLEFTSSMRTGEVPFERAHGQPFWDYLAEHPDEGLRFDRTQEAMTQLEVLGVLRAYSWQDASIIADLGGGNGAFLAGVLARCAWLRGIVYDLPHAVAHAPETLACAKVADRCDIVAGNLYDRVPAGADTYVMKRVLWGHPDEAAVRMLRHVRAVIGPRGRLLIIEPVLEDAVTADLGWSAALAALHDLRLFLFGQGRARTRTQIESLFSVAGLRLRRVLPALVTTIIEAVPNDATADPA